MRHHRRIIRQPPRPRRATRRRAFTGARAQVTLLLRPQLCVPRALASRRRTTAQRQLPPSPITTLPAARRRFRRRRSKRPRRPCHAHTTTNSPERIVGSLPSDVSQRPRRRRCRCLLAVAGLPPMGGPKRTTNVSPPQACRFAEASSHATHRRPPSGRIGRAESPRCRSDSGRNAPNPTPRRWRQVRKRPQRRQRRGPWWPRARAGTPTFR
mmetsp:Transcript_44285/g.136703  ORF Transcript_44285/g.136703 Transcript_44285/m.136703 type:complete len:211 (+) Transcript_44285:905-1537(+)